MPPPSARDLAEAALHVGERLLAALDRDDLDAARAAAEEREALVKELVASGSSADAEMAARFKQQGDALVEQLGHTHGRLADALRQFGRVQHATDQYAGGTPVQARLQARG